MTSFEHLALSGSAHHLGDPETTLVAGERYLTRAPGAPASERMAPDLLIAFNVEPETHRENNGYIISEQGKPPPLTLPRLANETITMLREKREKVVKEDGSIAARNIIARLGKGELRTDAALREQVLDVLVVHRHLIPTARRGHYMMMVPHD